MCGGGKGRGGCFYEVVSQPAAVGRDRLFILYSVLDTSFGLGVYKCAYEMTIATILLLCFIDKCLERL